MSEMTTAQEGFNTLLEKEGKYLTFVLGDEEYGLEILKVREIFGYMNITAVPRTALPCGSMSRFPSPV